MSLLLLIPQFYLSREIAGRVPHWPFQGNRFISVLVVPSLCPSSSAAFIFSLFISLGVFWLHDIPFDYQLPWQITRTLSRSHAIVDLSVLLAYAHTRLRHHPSHTPTFLWQRFFNKVWKKGKGWSLEKKSGGRTAIKILSTGNRPKLAQLLWGRNSRWGGKLKMSLWWKCQRLV